MKPKNNTEVRKAYLRFAGYLTCCTILAVSIFACFLKTSGIEVKRITEQALEYDHIYAKELSPVEQHGLHLPVHETDEHFTANKRQAPAKRSQCAQDEPAQICPRHGYQRLQAYRQLLENLNIFLGVKDSIRLLNIQEEMVKKDLMQCIQDNWKTRRNLNVGSGGNKQ